MSIHFLFRHVSMYFLNHSVHFVISDLVLHAMKDTHSLLHKPRLVHYSLAPKSGTMGGWSDVTDSLMRMSDTCSQKWRKVADKSPTPMRGTCANPRFVYVAPCGCLTHMVYQATTLPSQAEERRHFGWPPVLQEHKQLFCGFAGAMALAAWTSRYVGPYGIKNS